MRLVAALALVVALAAPAAASGARPTLADLEDEVMCPTCEVPLDQSNAPAAQQLKRLIAQWIAAGDSKQEIKARLVADFGDRVLAAPPREGFNLLAWALPLVGLGVGAAVLGAAVWRWSHTRERPAAPADPRSNGRVALDPELERRLDEELARFEA